VTMCWRPVDRQLAHAQVLGEVATAVMLDAILTTPAAKQARGLPLLACVGGPAVAQCTNRCGEDPRREQLLEALELVQGSLDPMAWQQAELPAVQFSPQMNMEHTLPKIVRICAHQGQRQYCVHAASARM